MSQSTLPAYTGAVAGRAPSHSPRDDSPDPPEVPAYFARKVFYARLFATFLLIAFAPLMLLFLLLVRLTSRGPALFRQTRLGMGGVPFEILKLRTMYCDAEELSGPTLCQPGDSRITPLGRLMRFLHIDELPQLVNVIRGEMCLVGPRPERPEIIARHQLNERVPGFAERTLVRPGVTGLAQINLPADISAECVIPKVRLDLEYIRTAGLGLDLRILLCTALRMLGVRHGRAVHLLGLGRSTATEPRATTPASPLSERPLPVYRGASHPGSHADVRHLAPQPPLALAASAGEGSGAFRLAELVDDDLEPWASNGDRAPARPNPPRKPR